MTTELKDKLEVAKAARKADLAHSRVEDLLLDDSVRQQLQRAMPSQLSADRFMRVLLTECRQNTRLLECTPKSFLACILDMAGLGLEPGPLGYAYLVPYRDTKNKVTICTFILGYKGMIYLARESQQIAGITAEVVHQGDQFDYELGSSKRIYHKPAPGNDDPMAPGIFYYAIAHYKDGGPFGFDFKVLSKKEVDYYRSKSRARDEGPWVTEYNAMGRKTAVRRLSPFLPLTPRAAEAIELDEQREFGLQRSAIEGVLDQNDRLASSGADAATASAPVTSAPPSDAGVGKPASAQSATPGTTGPAPQPAGPASSPQQGRLV